MDNRGEVRDFLTTRRARITPEQAGLANYAGILTPQTLPLNLARFLFLHSRAAEFFAEWASVADNTVAGLRTQAGRSPLDRNLTDLVGELATRSDQFRTRWARHNVRLHRTSPKRIASCQAQAESDRREQMSGDGPDRLRERVDALQKQVSLSWSGSR